MQTNNQKEHHLTPRPGPSTTLTRVLLCGVVVAMTGALGAGCGDDGGDEVVAVKPVEAKPVEAPPEPTAEEKKSEEEALAYTYNAVNRRDPFKTYFDELLLEDQQNKNLTELQRFELDNLNLVAVVVGTATPMAMVEDPSGKGHTVKIGTLVGKHFGQVKHIRRGEIIVQEEFRDFTGRRISTLKSLKLQEKEGG
jgi:type IV pilus assembly protein PilP